MGDELEVVTKAKELCRYVVDATNKSPKRFRFTFVSRMQNIALDIIENLFLANEVFIGTRYTHGDATAADVQQRVNSYVAHLAHGDTYALRRDILHRAVFTHASYGGRPERRV
jgi:hypothetical protein